LATTPDTPKPQRHLPFGGVLSLIAGVFLTATELSTKFIEGRLGSFGHGTILFCGTLFAVWGLKEMIAGWWPRIGRNTLIRNRFHLPTEGWAFLMMMFVLFIGSLMGRSNPLMLVFSMMAGAFVMNGWLTFTYLKGVTVERVLPERVMAGEPFSVEVSIRNSKGWLSAWMMTVKDHVLGRSTTLAPEVAFIRVPPGEHQRGHYQLVLAERGRYEFGPVYVDTRFPLGLVERGLNLEVAARLRVYPRLGRLQPDWKRKLQNATEQTSSQIAQGGVFADEFHRLREYRPGDDLRSIHWRTSARRNELMVREHRDSRDRSLLILVDSWLPARSGESTIEDFEHALSFAATICVDAARNSRESRITLAVKGESLRVWRGGSGGERIEDLLDVLADVFPNNDTKLGPLFEATSLDRSGLPRVLLLTARPNEAQAEIQKQSVQDHTLSSIQVLSLGSPNLKQIFEVI
jgi:uncharacterized protein (DUF58 family)